jgi:hypothetical protein
MLAHCHGQTWNASEFARSFAVADTTVRRYLGTLTAALVVRQLPPWSENVGKRQVKSPKVYLVDSGLLHTLLGLETQGALKSHPKLGASWEGFGIQAVMDRLGARSDECFFWATYAGAELDLLVVRGQTRLGFEFKRTAAPRLTPSMRVATKDLGLARLDVVHAGGATFPLAPRIRALALDRVLDDLMPLGRVCAATRTTRSDRGGLQDFVERWTRAGPALEEQRYRALQGLDDEAARRMTLDLFALWRPSGSDEMGAGLVEAQQAFGKLARLEAEKQPEP